MHPELKEKIAKATMMLAQAAGYDVQNSDPQAGRYMDRYLLLSNKAELCALRDQLIKGKLDVNSLESRTADYMDEYTKIICDKHGISIDSDGTITGGIIKPN